ncbi:MAG: STAS domain-containing protein [Candidatus Nanopelagicales bacterium]
MHLHVGTRQEGPATVVEAVGELDLHTAPMLQTELDQAIDAHAALVVVDLGRVDFMDSTGLSVIVATVAALRQQGGALRVVSSSDRITKVFTLTGVDQQVGMFGTVEEAVL